MTRLASTPDLALPADSFFKRYVIRIETKRGLQFKKELLEEEPPALEWYVEAEIKSLFALLEKYDIPHGDPNAFVFLALALARRYIKKFPSQKGPGRPKTKKCVTLADLMKLKKPVRKGAPIKWPATFRAKLLATIDEEIKPALRASTKRRVSDKEALLHLLGECVPEPKSMLKTFQNQLAIARQKSRKVIAKSARK